MTMTDEALTDMGLLAQFSYKPNGLYPILENTNIMSFEDDGKTFTLSTSYTVIDYTPEDTLTGMQALLLQKTGSNDFVIAFRGTSGGWDIAVDALQGLTNYNLQIDAARDFVQQMMDAHNIAATQLTLTGHSLGGILTQAVGADLGIKGYAYNPLGAQLLNKLGNTPMPMGVYTLLSNTLQVLGIEAPNEAWAQDNMVTVSFHDEGIISGDPLSNMATDLSRFIAGNEHYGSIVPIVGIEDASVAAGHNVVTLNSAIADYARLLSKFNNQDLDYKTLGGILTTTGVLGPVNNFV